ncbi:MAG: hypothetical protein DMF24_09865 [Verrucomicrobia bacterium]|nr:MAG: hypothetical protein DME90_04715 [Verrucomicrobiota bacterium]PYL60539.1 MAG: hypothetical protein DMF24_09865 [Verrucomicrobiota bacterium]
MYVEKQAPWKANARQLRQIATDSRADGYKRAQLAFTDSPRHRARSCKLGHTGLEKSAAVAGGISNLSADLRRVEVAFTIT